MCSSSATEKQSIPTRIVGNSAPACWRGRTWSRKCPNPGSHRSIIPGTHLLSRSRELMIDGLCGGEIRLQSSSIHLQLLLGSGCSPPPVHSPDESQSSKSKSQRTAQGTTVSLNSLSADHSR